MPELYAGPLIRWYRQDFSGGSPPSDLPDPADIAAVVARWRTAFQPAIGPVTWTEDPAAPVHQVSIPASHWADLLLDAARPLTLEDALSRRPRDVPAYPLLMATAWIPASFDGILPIGLPDQPDSGALASLDRLDRWIAVRRLARWGAHSPRDAVDDALQALADAAAFAKKERTLLLSTPWPS